MSFSAMPLCRLRRTAWLLVWAISCGWATGCGWTIPASGPLVYPGAAYPGEAVLGQQQIPIGPASVGWENPALVPHVNRDFVWEQVVDVVDDYFRIERERRVRLVGNVLTEGRIDTFPQDGATWFEPHLGDSVGRYNRLESTFQSIRRQAVVHVIPAEGGFLVDVTVTKELEDLPQPERATAGAASFRYDNSLPNRTTLSDAEELPRSWIPRGRDTALEQQMLAQLLARFGTVAHPSSWQ